jgi:hypothetical protein
MTGYNYWISGSLFTSALWRFDMGQTNWGVVLMCGSFAALAVARMWARP